MTGVFDNNILRWGEVLPLFMSKSSPIQRQRVVDPFPTPEDLRRFNEAHPECNGRYVIGETFPPVLLPSNMTESKQRLIQSLISSRLPVVAEDSPTEPPSEHVPPAEPVPIPHEQWPFDISIDENNYSDERRGFILKPCIQFLNNDDFFVHIQPVLAEGLRDQHADWVELCVQGRTELSQLAQFTGSYAED
jgi:hypothetical protein